MAERDTSRDDWDDDSGPAPINDQGQTVEGGHRWMLNPDRTKVAFMFDHNAYHTYAMCNNCNHTVCTGCDHNDWATSMCDFGRQEALPLG